MPPSYYEVLEASNQPGCPLCRLSEKWVNRYLTSVLYEKVNDPGIREALQRSQGYCNEHAWRLPQISGGPALGTALLYRSVLRQAAAEMASAHLGAPPQACPACEHREEMTTSALASVAEALAANDGRMLAALRKSAGLCLPHLRRALALAQDEAVFEAMLALASEKVEALARELDEFIRKNDHHFVTEGFGAEGDSWLRAIGWAAGAKGVR